MRKFTLLVALIILSGCLYAQFSGGDGTPGNPYRISSADDLNNIRTSMNGYFVQTADIDISGFSNWEPIGGAGSSQAFTGNYDGKGFEITGLRINRPGTPAVGLFGIIGEGTVQNPVVIRNVRLKNINVTGGVGTGALSGTVQGNVYTLIEGCSVEGETGARSVTGDGFTGGLSGCNTSAGNSPGGGNNPMIIKCSANVDVYYSGAQPSGQNRAAMFGGLAGCNRKGIILDSYSRGKVTAIKNGSWEVAYAGGLVGCTGSNGIIDRCFSTGFIAASGAVYTGGLAGSMEDESGHKGSVTHAFWDTQTSGKSTSPGGTGLTTVQMQSEDSFIGFDFSMNWIFSPGVNNDYPLLRPVLSSTFNTWKGQLSSVWTMPANWSMGRVPGKQDMIVIPGGSSFYPEISTILDGQAVPQSMAISGEGYLTVNPGGSLRVQGPVLNDNGIHGLILNSDNSGTGIISGHNDFLEATINLTIEAAAWDMPGKGWHLLSSPVEAQSIDGDWTPDGEGNDFKFFAFDGNQPSTCWLDARNPEYQISSFRPGTGYLVAYQSAGVHSFSGTLNSSAIALQSLGRSSTGMYPGFHLAGNPFMSPIDWNSGSWIKENISSSAVYLWNSESASYLTLTETGGIIPPMNGFMVYTSGNGQLTIPPDACIGDKSAGLKDNNDFLLLKVTDQDAGTSQTSIVRFDNHATEGFDMEYDAHFLPGYAPMFYSRSWDAFLALNTLPSINEMLYIPFGFVKNGSSLYTIELAKTIPGANVYLTDLKTNKVTQLSKLPVYSFMADDGDDPDRFLLHFGTLGTGDDNPLESVSVYAYNGVIRLSGLPAGADISLAGIMGNVIRQTSCKRQDSLDIDATGLPRGIYVVMVRSEGKISSTKIVL